MNKAFDILRVAIKSCKTGELIIAGTDLEAHVFIQAGRLAWAYNSVERSTFLQEIRWAAKLDDDTLREVFEECRVNRKHVAETLIAWGLANPCEVRRALWWQIATTLRVVRNSEAPEGIFLLRGGPQYNQELTFELAEFERDTISAPPSAEQVDSGKLADGSSPSLQPSMVAAQRESDSKLESAVSSAIPSSMWVKICRAERAASLFDAKLVHLLGLLSKADVSEAIFRRNMGWVLALRVSPSSMLFCGLRSSALLSRVRAAIHERAGIAALATPLTLSLGAPMAASVGFPDNAEFSGILSQFSFVAALLVINPKGATQLSRAGVSASLAEELLGLAPLLESPLDEILRAPASSPPMPLTPGVRLLFGGYQCFGALLDEGTGTSVWVAIDGSVSEGFGWGILTSALKAASAA